MWLEAVKQNGMALEYASKEFKADKEVVLAAVMQNPRALKFASEELRNGGLHAYAIALTMRASDFRCTVLIAARFHRLRGNPDEPFLLAAIERLGVEGGTAFMMNLADYLGVRCAGVDSPTTAFAKRLREEVRAHIYVHQLLSL